MPDTIYLETCTPSLLVGELKILGLLRSSEI
jgi:hypothetical protein